MLTRVYVIIFAIISIATSTATVDPGKYDTIVVGLGAAGTVAASTLAKAGKKVLALEAQDRIGGRVYTVPFGDGIVEVGAEWIHGTEGSRIYKAAIDNNVTVLLQDMRFQIIKSDGSLADALIDELLEYIFDMYEDKPKKPEPFGDHINKKLTEHIKEKAPDVYANKKYLQKILELANRLVADDWGAYDTNDLNAADSYVGLEGYQTMSWHRHGYKTFFDIMLNKYNGGPGLPSLLIKLDSEVTKIEWPQEAEGHVSVTTKDGTVYMADNVIITVSLGVLKEKHKTLFAPPLPQNKVTAIEKIQMGLIGKIIFSFPTVWWPNKNTSWAFLWNDEDLNVDAEDRWTTKIGEASPPMGSSNTITLWSSGDTTKEIEYLPDEIVKSKAMGLIKRFAGANTTVPDPIGMIRSKWFSNEFTRGTYSYDRMSAADVPTARTDLAEPLKDSSGKLRVLFAGEASHPTRFATVHGAADTGHREAMRLINSQ